MKDLLDSWEADAKGLEYGTRSADRILKLIDLVRKKDRYLKSASLCIHLLTCDDMDLNSPCSQDCRDMTQALALTEKLN